MIVRMRCPVCEETVALRTEDPETLVLKVEMDRQDAVEMIPEAIVSTKVRLVKKCANCEEEMLEAVLEQHAYVDVDKLCTCSAEDRELVVEDIEVELVEKTGGKYIGFCSDAVVICNSCDETWDVTLENTMMAVDMRRLV